MRLLKQSTVERELKRRGWEHMANLDDDPKGKHYMMDGYGGGRLFALVEPGGRIAISDGRLLRHSNVHIVSYLGPFRTTADMRKWLDDSEKVYTWLCGTKFPGHRHRTVFRGAHSAGIQAKDLDHHGELELELSVEGDYAEHIGSAFVSKEFVQALLDKF